MRNKPAIVRFLPLFLAGCTPFVEYEHLSNPSVADDGYDLVCVGVTSEILGMDVDAAPCQDMSGTRDRYIKVSARREIK